MKLSDLNPDTEIADVTEEGPGKGLIFIPSEIVSLTSRRPGSDISGVPALNHCHLAKNELKNLVSFFQKTYDKK